MRRGTHKATSTQKETRVVDPKTGFLFLDGRTRTEGEDTIVRLLPAVERDDKGALTILPLFEEEFDPSEPATMLGDQLFATELTDIYMPGAKAVFRSTISETDSAGRPVPGYRSTPAGAVAFRYGFNTRIQQTLIAKGYKCELPKTWMENADRSSINAREYYLTQALALQIDGNGVSDPRTGQAYRQAVFCINKGVEPDFVATATSRLDAGKPLTEDNIPPHQNLFGRNGYLLKLSRKDNAANKMLVKYSLHTLKPLPLTDAQVLKLALPWDEALVDMTVEESIAMLLKCCGPLVVSYGLRGTPYAEYLEDAVRDMADDIPMLSDDYRNMAEVKALPPARKSGTSRTPFDAGSDDGGDDDHLEGLGPVDLDNIRIDGAGPAKAAAKAAKPTQTKAKVPENAEEFGDALDIGKAMDQFNGVGALG